MKKSIFLFFAAILCATSALAYDLAAGQYVYFEKPSDWTQATLLLGHNTYSVGYNMTNISNTNLYYWKTDSWNGYYSYAFIDAKVTSSDWGGEGNGDSSKPDTRKKWAAHYSSTFTSAIVKYHLFNTTKSVSSHASDRKTAINRTQTIKVQLKDGSNWVDATVVPADLTASTYAMTTSSTAVSAASASLAKESATVSATVDAAYSATVTLSCTNVADGYMFDGWYDEGGNKITSYTVSAAATVYARFTQSAEKTNLVTVSYMCGATDVAASETEQVGVETEKTFTAPTVTGYNFTGWTKGVGIVEKSSTENTITIVTKTGETDYTLVANYEEVLETVYFINTGKWSDVYIHLWNGTATGTEWPGAQLTATGTKIGEYDVYEYTAQQGAHVNLLFHKKDNDSQKTADLTWTAGKYYIHNHNGNTGWYTQAEAEEILVVPVVEETVYFVNNKNWTKVQVHAWKDAVNNGWPGQALTATGKQVAGFDVYSFTAAQGTYTNLLFNNKEGDAGVQSSNFVWTADKYYYMGAAADYAGGTEAEVETALAPDPLATNVYLVGGMNSWNTTANEFRLAVAGDATASVTVTLPVGETAFKVTVSGDWHGNNGTMTRNECTGWTFKTEDGDCKINADVAGEYIFTWHIADKKLSVTYPALPAVDAYKVTVPAGTLECYIAGSFDSWASFHKMIKEDETHYTISIPGANTGHTYKYASGPSWDFEEVTATDGHVESRTYNAADEVAKWKAVYDPDAVPQELVYNVEVPAGTEACYIAMDSDPSQDGWEFTAMTKVDATHYTFTRTGLKTDAYKYACQASWDYAEKDADGNDVSNRTWKANDVVAKWGAPAPAEPVISYVLMGVNGDWTTGIELVPNPGNNDEYMLLEQNISRKTDAVKVVKLVNGEKTEYYGNLNAYSNTVPSYDNDWNLVLESGVHSFYFNTTNNEVYIFQSVYRREVTNKYGTICLPYAALTTSGAHFYRVAGKGTENGKTAVYLESVDAVEAGVPYIFEKTASTIEVVYDQEKPATGALIANGLVGTFANNTEVAPTTGYILYNDAFCMSDGSAKVNAYRAYLNLNDIVGGKPQQMPGRRYIGMDVQGENEATGLDNIATSENAVKVISNGQLIIIRGGEKFNAQGIKL